MPKEEYQDAKVILHNINQMDALIRLGVVKYHTFECADKFFVTAYSNILEKHRIIKAFPKGDTEDSADYARLCAEELCEKLNEWI